MSSRFSKLGEAIVDYEPQPQTALEFLLLLSRLSEPLRKLNEGARRSLVFRGIGRSSYRMVPSSLRKDGPLWKVGVPHMERLAAMNLPGRNVGEFGLTAVAREAYALRSFLDRLNEVSLAAPINLDSARAMCDKAIRCAALAYGSLHDAESTCRIGEIVWPPNELMTALSFAQHFQVPTRLLDFTTSPHRAAYFAAEDWSANECDDGGFSVICLRPDRLPRFANEPRWLLCEEPAKHGNANAVAQLSTFVYERSAYPEQMVCLRTLSELFPYGDLEEIPYEGDEPVGLKITCPYSEGREALKLLAQLGIEKRHVYPHPSIVAGELVSEIGQSLHQVGN